jgi:hypothetical protein
MRRHNEATHNESEYVLRLTRTCFKRSAAFRCDGRKSFGPPKQVRATRRGTIHLAVKRPAWGSAIPDSPIEEVTSLLAMTRTYVGISER